MHAQFGYSSELSSDASLVISDIVVLSLKINNNKEYKFSKFYNVRWLIKTKRGWLSHALQTNQSGSKI